MSNSIIPHLLSDSPPPIASNVDEDYEDEFGDFRGPGDLSFDNDNLSSPSTPKHSENFYTNYPSFDLDGVEHFEINKQSGNESPLKDNTKELPNKNYINILDHLENNIPNLEVHDRVNILNIKSEDETNSKVSSPVNIIKLQHNSEDNEIIVTCDKKHSTEVVSHAKFEKDLGVSYFQCDHDPDDSKHQENTSHTSLENKKVENDNISPLDSVSEDNDSIEIKHNNIDETVCNAKTLEEDNSQKCGRSDNSVCISNFQLKNQTETELQNFNFCDMNKEEKFGDFDETKFKDGNSDENWASSDTFFEIDTPLSNLKETQNHTETVQSPNIQTVEFKIETDSMKVDVQDSTPNDYDDFGEYTDFSQCQSESNIIHSNNLECDESKHSSENEFEDFGNFQGFEAKDAFEETVVQEKIEANDDFDDFADYSTFNKHTSSNEFSEYSQFNKHGSIQYEAAQTPESLIKICEDPEEAFKQAQVALKNIFGEQESNSEDYVKFDFTVDDPVFENLKDITETNALTYQWDKSSAQKYILKTLNIDKRNILYGTNWNTGVPIFAANLCSTPLEPIKSDVTQVLTPQKVVTPQEFVASDDVSITGFDWNTSELSNPLSSLEGGDKHSISSTLSNTEKSDVPSSTSTQNSDDILSNFADIQKDMAVVNIPQITGMDEVLENQKEDENEDDFSDFTSYQPNYGNDPEWTNNMLPLRESHICHQPPSISMISSMEESNESLNVVNFSTNFDLSILEPKEVILDNTREKSNFTIDCKEFESPYRENKLIVEKETSTFYVGHSSNSAQYSENSNRIYSIAVLEDELEEHVAKISSKPHSNADEVSNTNISITNLSDDTKQPDEEFTDFCSSLPQISEVSLQPRLSLTEPLQPAVLHPIPSNARPIIDWPAPGLDEDEVNRIVNGCLKNDSGTTEKIKSSQRSIHKGIPFTKHIVSSSNDEDEWTDFVSVKEQVKSRTSTPDLPLSVFNLGNIQPVKAPTPLVTPNGVVCSPVKKPSQEMITSNMSLNFFKNSHNHAQPQMFVNSQPFHSLYQYPKNNMLANTMCDMISETKPTPTSTCNGGIEERRMSFGQNMNTNFPRSENFISSQNQSISSGYSQSSSSFTNKFPGDDDEWSEFVSASNTPSYIITNPTLLQSTTNIITNPSHNMAAFSKDISQSTSRCTVVRQERRNIPTISALPDLNFVSPRSRSMRK